MHDVSPNGVNNVSYYQIKLQLLELPKNQNKQSWEPKMQTRVLLKPPLPMLQKALTVTLPSIKVELTVNKVEGGVTKTETSNIKQF